MYNILVQCSFKKKSHNTEWTEKTEPNLEVYNFCIWWYGRAFCVSKCSPR